MTSFDKIYMPISYQVKEDFDDDIRGIKCTDEEFANIIKVCKENNLIILKDLLEYYNNLDVVPFYKACYNQRQVFYDTFNIDIYKDGITISNVAQIIMNRYMTKDLMFQRNKVNTAESNGKIDYTTDFYIHKIRGYIAQDKDKLNKCDLTPESFQVLVNHYRGKCLYCHYPLDESNLTLDRDNNHLGHTYYNVALACRYCNVRRKDTDFKKFYSDTAYLTAGGKNSFIWIINEDNFKVYQTIKENIVGGPSIVR